jgi:uroporphyrinogen-III decarboxylase
MTRRERLMATMRGETVDRPAVSFYEIDGLRQDESRADPFNIYADPSWKPALELARERTDRIVMTGVGFKGAPPDPVAELTTVETWEKGGSRFTKRTIRAGERTLETETRRDPDVDTVWTTSHLLKSAEDLEAWVALPERPFGGEPIVDRVLDVEERLGDSGIAMIDTEDPLCAVAGLFDMGDFTIIAMTERELFREALDKAARAIHPRVEAVARALPGRLWRIYGPEYAAPPYMPPSLFEEYVTRYDTPMVEAIQRHGGFARLHSHGMLREVIDLMAQTGCSGLDPIEPPPQGNVTLAWVRERHGQQMVLFGNLEASDLEQLTADEFERKIATAVEEGTSGTGRGFVLMPSACPIGRELSERALGNYERMVEFVERM